DMLERTDGLVLGIVTDSIKFRSGEETLLPLQLRNQFNTTTRGQLSYKVYDAVMGREVSKQQDAVVLEPFGGRRIAVSVPAGAVIMCQYTFTEEGTGLTLLGKFNLPYILTPAPSAAPRINSPKVFGVRAGSLVLFRIAASGDKPMRYVCMGL